MNQPLPSLSVGFRDQQELLHLTTAFWNAIPKSIPSAVADRIRNVSPAEFEVEHFLMTPTEMDALRTLNVRR